MDIFIFNLNKNKKYKKLKNEHSIYCHCLTGPLTTDFGCNVNDSMKSITHHTYAINEYYDKGSDILPSDIQRKVYNLTEAEVYEIIIV